MPANFYFSVNNPNVCCNPQTNQSEVITSHFSEDKELQKLGVFSYLQSSLPDLHSCEVI